MNADRDHTPTIDAPATVAAATEVPVINTIDNDIVARRREKIFLEFGTVTFLLLEMVLAFVVFVIVTMELFRENSNHPMTARHRITYVITATIAIIFEPVIFVTLCFIRKFYLFSFMSFTMSITAFVTFLAISITAFLQAYPPQGEISALEKLGGWSLVTAIVFVSHAIAELWKFFLKSYQLILIDIDTRQSRSPPVLDGQSIQAIST